MEHSRVTFDVSWRALLKIVLLGAGLYVASLLRDVLVMLLVVFITVAAVNPTVVFLQRRMSRLVAVTLLYIVVAVVVALIGVTLLPLLFRQFRELVTQVPHLTATLAPTVARLHTSYPSIGVSALGSLNRALSDFSGSFVQNAYDVAGSLAIIVSGAVISFYLLLEEKNAREFFHQALPSDRYRAVYLTVSKISERMGRWVRGEALLILIIGSSSFVLYAILGVPTPLPLAVWTGLMEVIPVVGGVLGVLPAVFITLAQEGPLRAAAVFLAYFIIIQQLEAHVVVPKVMGKALGLSPVLVIISLLVGVKLFGLLGALVAVPTAAVISVIAGEWPSLRRIWEGEAV